MKSKISKSFKEGAARESAGEIAFFPPSTVLGSPLRLHVFRIADVLSEQKRNVKAIGSGKIKTFRH